MMIASHLPNPALEVLVAGGDDVALVLRDPLDEAVVRVRPLVQAREALEPRVLHDLQREKKHLIHVKQWCPRNFWISSCSSDISTTIVKINSH